MKQAQKTFLTIRLIKYSIPIIYKFTDTL